jgi:tripartite-type tricarboxylate transporter receptor subunit TctC
MKIPRRRFLHLAVGAAALPAVSRIARAQSYPSRPVRIIVGAPPGGGHDTAARLISPWLAERLGQSVLIDNRPGANTNIGAQAVAKAPPDGYTLLLVGATHAINVGVYGKLAVDVNRDIAPVAAISRGPLGMLIHPSVPAKSVPEFIAYAKANPGKLNMGSGGIGNGEHVAGELFKLMTGISMLHVPYRGTAPALTDLLGGQTQVHFAALSASIEHIRAGKLRALAVTSAARLPMLPEVPTISDFLPGYQADGWQGIGAPKNTPAEIVEKLNKEVNAALADPKMKARLADLGSVPMPMTPSEFSMFIAEETEKWGKVIRAANIKPE